MYTILNWSLQPSCSNTIKVLTGAYVYNFELIIAALTAPQFHAKGCPGLKPSAPFYLLSIPISYLPTFIQKREHHDLLKQVVNYCYIKHLVNWPLMKGWWISHLDSFRKFWTYNLTTCASYNNTRSPSVVYGDEHIQEGAAALCRGCQLLQAPSMF